MRRRFAFTLVELLVVIAIIGYFGRTSFTCSASRREAARRMSCQNNMKQIGLAMHNFESAYKFFPPARVDAAPGFPVVEMGVPAPTTGTIAHGPGIFLLPFMEQQAIYNLYDMKQTWSSAANAAAVKSPIPSFNCPSTPQPPNRLETVTRLAVRQRIDGWVACSDYSIANGMNGRLGLSPYNLMPPIPGYDSANPATDATQYIGAVLPMSTISSFTTGMSPPFYNKRLKSKFASIVDGSSNTFAWVEDAGRPFLYRGPIGKSYLAHAPVGQVGRILIPSFGWTVLRPMESPPLALAL